MSDDKIFKSQVMENFGFPAPTGQGANKKHIVDDAFLAKVREIVMNGAIYQNEIFPLFNLSQRKWQYLKVTYPQIQETIDAATAERDYKVQTLYKNIIEDTTHKGHKDMLKHYLDRMDRRYGKKTVEVIHKNNKSDADELSPEQLLEQLDGPRIKKDTQERIN